MMFDFLSFKKQITSVRSQMDGLVNHAKNKRAEIDHLRTSPPPKADVISFFNGRADQLAANYNVAFETAVHRVSKHPLTPKAEHGIGIFTATPPNVAATCHSLEIALLAIFHDEIKESLRKRIEAMQWPANAGPPIAERPALIEKAERELAVLEKDLAELQSQAAEAGVLI